MTDMQRLLWDRMYHILEEFYAGHLPFHEVVYRLDDAMDMADVHEPWILEALRKAWEPLYQTDLEQEDGCLCVDIEKVGPPLKAFAEALVLTYHRMNRVKSA